jgi:hypothetical protein
MDYVHLVFYWENASKRMALSETNLVLLILRTVPDS